MRWALLSRTLPLRFRLATAAAILIGVTCGLLYAFVPAQLHRLSNGALHDKATTIARITAYSAAPAVLFGDSIEVDETLASAILDPDLALIEIRDDAGVRLGMREVERRAGPRLTEAVAAITHDGRNIGEVRVALSLMRADEALSRSRMSTTAISAILFVLAVLSALAISAVVTEPVAQVSATAGAIARGAALKHVKVTSRDEVGELAASFNLMIDRLEQAQLELRSANALLEQRVDARTAELRASEQRFRGIFESAAVGIALLDAGAHVIDANPALLAILGVDDTAATGASLESRLAPADVSRFRARLDRVRSGRRETESAPVQLVDAAGAPHSVVCTISAVAGGTEDSARFIVLLEDVTEQRALEERFRQAQKLEAVGRLAGGIAHDFNNLLVTINGLADLLLADTSQDDPVHRDLLSIRTAGDRAAQLTRQLLAFSRRQVLQPQLVSINEMAAEVGRMLGRVIGENIELRVVLDDAAGHVRADPGQITQVIMNLAVNARDAMSTGGTLELRTAAVAVDDAMAGRFELCSRGPHVLLSVRDTGSGMDDETRAQIFEPFFTTKPVGEGTGLGLATVYGIVRQSHGGIVVESAPGAGSTFHVLFPVAGEPAPVASGARSEREAAPSNGETILVVEDELTVRSLIARVLRRQGYTVLEATGGGHALEIAREHPGAIALLLSDIVMPGMSGPDLARAFHVLSPGTPIVFMSGYTPEAARAETLGEGAAFIQKPMSPATLARVVRTVLDEATAHT